MSDENPNPAPAPRSSGGSSVADVLRLERQVDSLKDQLRAVSSERKDAKDALKTFREQVADYDTLKQTATESTTALDRIKRESAAQLQLADLGINSARARRTILRDYDEEYRDTPADQRPALTEHIEKLRDDPFMARLLPTPAAAAAPPAGAPAAAAAPPASNAPGAAPAAAPPAAAAAPTGSPIDPNGGTGGGNRGAGEVPTVGDFRRDVTRIGRPNKEWLAKKAKELTDAGVFG
jgi:hypothetical protein